MESKIHSVEHSYFEIRQLCLDLTARYPFLSKRGIGRSVAGRDITALALGGGDDTVLFVGGDDPAYRVSTLVLLKFIEELCHDIRHGKDLCGLNVRKALFGRKLIFVPQLNPDGAEIAYRGKSGCSYMPQNIEQLCGGKFDTWRSNLRGVEIAKNFPYKFAQRQAELRKKGHISPAPFGFAGHRALSEPETAAFVKLCREEKIRHLICLSSGGDCVTYSGDPATPRHSEKMAEIIGAVASYEVCPPFAKADTEICDWFTYEFSSPALCIKSGKESIPQVKDLYPLYLRLKEALTLSAVF